MDALPLSINQHQIELMNNQISQSIADLQEKNKAKQFASGDEKKKEQNLLTYGTDNYEEAHALVQAIADELQSHLKAWNNTPPDTSQPISLDLNSYQFELLRASIEHKMDNLQDQQTRHLLENLVNQLPEFSPNEQSD